MQTDGHTVIDTGAEMQTDKHTDADTDVDTAAAQAHKRQWTDGQRSRDRHRHACRHACCRMKLQCGSGLFGVRSAGSPVVGWEKAHVTAEGRWMCTL